MNRWRLIVVFGFVVASLLTTQRGLAQQPPAPSPVDVTVAQRLADLAQYTVQPSSGRPPDEVALRQAIALLQGARKLNPTEPRYLSLLEECSIRLNDDDLLADVLAAYRALPGKAEDRGAQIEYIDLMAKRMQTVDERIRYLAGISDHAQVPKEVRSVAALKAAGLYLEKIQDDEARAALDKALALDPLNFPALKIKYAMTARTMRPAERFAMRLAMLRSNPAQPELIVAIAQDLAGAGLPAESIQWYKYLAGYVDRQGSGIPPDISVQVAAQAYLNGDNKTAIDLLDKLIPALQNLPDAQYQALIVRLLAERQTEKKDQIDKLRTAARNALVGSLSATRTRLKLPEIPPAIGADPTSRPAAPDLRPDIELARKLTDDDRRAYLQAVANLAWFMIFFENQTEEANGLLAVLTALGDADQPSSQAVLARFQGWVFLRTPGKQEEARVKLSAAAERDPLAELGLVRLMADVPDQLEQAKAHAQKLLAENEAGVWGAIMFDALRDLGIKVIPGPDAAAFKAELARLPKDWMTINYNPQAFYALRAEPLRVVFTYGEPILARVTITNTSEADLTIGNEGVIRPDVWIDAQMIIGGEPQNPQAGIAIERFTDQIVLRPRQSVSRVVRIDQGQLPLYLMSMPVPPVTFKATARTNGRMVQGVVQDRQVSYPTSVACGYAADFTRPMERAGIGMSNPIIERMQASATTGDGLEKLRAIEVLSMLSVGLRKHVDPQAQARGETLAATVKKAPISNDPSLRGWAGFVSCGYAYANREERAETLRRLLEDKAWQGRLVSLLLIANIAEDQRLTTLNQMAQADPDPTVRAMAAALAEGFRHPAATQPATQPATRPAAGKP
jgi:hypothetical protein